MSFLPKTKKGIKRWIIITATIILIIGVCVFGGYYLFNSHKILVIGLMILFTLVIAQTVFLVSLFEKEQSKISNVSGLQGRIVNLKRRLKKSEEISKNKSIYLSNMSHEIRIPLSNVLGMLNMLKESSLSEDQRAQIEIADYSSEHLLQLVNMILDNSKGVDHKMQLANDTLDLETDLTKLFKILEYQAWDKGLNFETKILIDKNHKFLLLGDIKRIQQVLINLISNAIKFTNNGKISVTIDHTVTDDENQIVTFYIKDTGIGMNAYEVKNIFVEPEERDSMSMQHYMGAGIGLSITDKLVRLMGGELKVESKENVGSTFYFSLQLQKTLNLKKEIFKPKSVLLNKFDYKFSVLVAEDNKMNQKVIKFLLEQQGVDCTFVTNGLDAFNLFKVLDFDMIFMDIYMPEMDGYEATKRIKTTEKYALNNIPIVAVSASAFEKDISKAKESGVDHFLSKPIEKEKLRELLLKYSPKKEYNLERKE